MIFNVENLGAIQHAEIDLSKDLILFCGHNNTGKTYLAYAIYYFLDIPIGTFHFGFPILDSQSDIARKIQAEVDKSIDNNDKEVTTFHVNLVELFCHLSEKEKENLLDYIIKNYAVGLGEFFGASDSSLFLLTKFSVLFSDEEINNGLLRIEIQLTNDQELKLSKLKNSPYFNIILDKNSNITSTDISYTIQHLILNSVFFSRRFIFTAERSAINLFSKELFLTKNKLFNTLLSAGKQAEDMLNLARQRVNRYAEPVRDNLEIAEDLSNLAKNISEFNQLAEELEKNVLGGKIHVSQYGDLTYSPVHAPNVALGMELSSSTVGSLSSLVFYLRHLARKGDTLIIDEPELSLHPDNQRLIARFFGRLINAGFKLIISTHSDYIVREINNLIMLSKKSRKTAGLRKKYGYTQAQVLQPQQVGAYLFKRGEPSPISIEVGETGLEISTIDEVVADLNQSSQDIYFSLFD